MKPRWLALVVGLQVAWLVGTAVTAQHNLLSGRVIRVETEPVDPRDLLRGDYIILNYAFSRLSPDRFEPPPPEDEALSSGTPVYVEFAPAGDYFRMQRVSLQPLEVPGDHVVLRGEVIRGNANFGSQAGGVRVAYGLERFYVREGTGHPRGSITVDVSVPESGIGMVKEVYVDGVPYADAE